MRLVLATTRLLLWLAAGLAGSVALILLGNDFARAKMPYLVVSVAVAAGFGLAAFLAIAVERYLRLAVLSAADLPGDAGARARGSMFRAAIALDLLAAGAVIAVSAALAAVAGRVVSGSPIFG